MSGGLNRFFLSVYALMVCGSWYTSDETGGLIEKHKPILEPTLGRLGAESPVGKTFLVTPVDGSISAYVTKLGSKGDCHDYAVKLVEKDKMERGLMIACALPPKDNQTRTAQAPHQPGASHIALAPAF